MSYTSTSGKIVVNVRNPAQTYMYLMVLNSKQGTRKATVDRAKFTISTNNQKHRYNFWATLHSLLMGPLMPMR